VEMNSTRTIAAPRDRVWAALNDPAVLVQCVPGCEGLVPDGVDAWKIVLAAKVGSVSARFTGRMALSDVRPPEGYTLGFDGQGGAAGFARGEAKVALAPAAGGAATDLSYAVKAQVGGKLAQVGSRLVDGAAGKLADDFFARFAAAVAPPVAAELASPPPPAARAAPTPRSWVRYAAIALMLIILGYLYSRAAR
jgi:uncharacterized protein